MNRLQIALSVDKQSQRRTEYHQNELEAPILAVEELSTLVGTTTPDTVRSRLTEQTRALNFEIERHLQPE